MTNEIFENGYKLLIRFFKEMGRYNDFKKITAKNNPLYKSKLKQQFEIHNGCGWYDFFTFTWFVGTNYTLYNDPKLDNLRKKWREFVRQYNEDLFC